MNQEQINAIELILADIDRACINEGKPIMSVIARTNDGKVSPVTLASILLYKLNLPNESLDETVVRLQNEAVTFYGKERQ